MITRPDTELVKAAQHGDKEAFGCLVTRYLSMARYIALTMVRHEELAYDLAQEAMLQAYLSLGNLRHVERFKNWLYGIVLNVCRSHIRNRRARFCSLEALVGGVQFDKLPFPTSAPDPEEIAEERELHMRVLEAVDALSPGNRSTVLAFYYKGLTLRETAALLGISVTAVKGRLFKSRRQLREHLMPYWEGGHAYQSDQRGKKMVSVSVADVIQAERDGSHIVALLDHEGRRLLPIWVGSSEGVSLALLAGEASMPRPLTYEFIARLLAAADVSLEEVRVEALKNSIFYAIVKIRTDDKVHEIDARPSDAIALALQAACPIYVAENIMESEGVDIGEEYELATQPGRGIGTIMDRVKVVREQAAFTTEPTTEETRQECAQRLLAYMFGQAEEY